MRLKTDRINGLRAAGPSILIGSIAIALIAQTFWILRPDSAGLPEAPTTSAETTLETTTASRPAMPLADPNGCETQHWPFYSSECLRGEGTTSIPRQVNLKQTFVPKAPSAALVVASFSTVEQKPKTPRETFEAPRHRKVRQTIRTTSRPVVRVRQMPPSEPTEFGPRLAFTW